MNVKIAALCFVVVSGLTYWLCGNAHIDIFPCTKTEADRTLATAYQPPPLRTRSGTCSLMAHQRGQSETGENERLTPAGWALLGAFCLGIGLAAGVGAGLVFRRKR